VVDEAVGVPGEFFFVYYFLRKDSLSRPWQKRFHMNLILIIINVYK
jgi:hypothetical protein